MHPSFAADAIEDAASFFDLMTVTDRIRYGAADQCAELARELRKSAQGGPRHGNIRLLHSLDVSIGEQISHVVGNLGGAVRIVAAAPFWDDGSAIGRLCASIGLDHLFSALRVVDQSNQIDLDDAAHCRKGFGRHHCQGARDAGVMPVPNIEAIRRVGDIG